jgi:HEAT repeat protein
LGTFGLGKTPSTSVLLEDLGSHRAAVRNYARHWLVKMGREAVPALTQTLALGNLYARGQAARALGEIGDAAAAPALVEALTDDQLSVHAMAAEALIALGQPALPALLKALVQRPDAHWLRIGAHVVLTAESRENWFEPIRPVVVALNSAAPASAVAVAARRALESLAASEETP